VIIWYLALITRTTDRIHCWNYSFIAPICWQLSPAVSLIPLLMDPLAGYPLHRPGLASLKSLHCTYLTEISYLTGILSLTNIFQFSSLGKLRMLRERVRPPQLEASPAGYLDGRYCGGWEQDGMVILRRRAAYIRGMCSDLYVKKSAL